MFYQVVHHALCTTLGQTFVVFVRAFVVGVGGEFDGDVRVLVQQSYQFVEGGGRLRTQRRLVEIVEDVLNQYGGGDIGERELQHVLF